MGRMKRCHHGWDGPCTCAMGNIYRFVEPVLLLLLKKNGPSCGYDLGNRIQEHAITDGQVEHAVLYRTLRTLESNGNVVSHWETQASGPARRVYTLTEQGEQHLRDWIDVLDRVSISMKRFVGDASQVLSTDIRR